jgi:hypothetical protein
MSEEAKMTDLKATLQKLNACYEAVKWVEDKDPETAWHECQRGDWLLWIAARLEIDRKLLVLAACDCAEPALVFVPDGEERPAKAIAAARAWAAGEANAFNAAKDFADGTAVADSVDAVIAAAAALYASQAVFRPLFACYAISSVADVSDPWGYLRAESLAHSATLVRDRIPFGVIDAGLQDKGES